MKRNLLEDCKWIILTEGWLQIDIKIQGKKKRHHSRSLDEFLLRFFHGQVEAIYVWYKIKCNLHAEIVQRNVARLKKREKKSRVNKFQLITRF